MGLNVGLVALIAFTPLAGARLLVPTSPSSTGPVTLLLHSFNLILAGMTIAIIATLNFGAAIFMSLLLALPLSLSHRTDSRVSQKVQHYGLVAINPIVIWSALRLWDNNLGNTFMQRLLEEWTIGGSWTLPMICLLVIPILLQGSIAAACN